MRLLVLCALMLAGLELEAAADATQRYVVRPGDSCISIAIRVVGDRAAVGQIHRLNPQLGATPHTLVPGSELVLPAVEHDPDARLTRTFGSVKIRTPASSEWDVAARGADLYRAYRVGAASQSSAEVKFADDGLLGMRERTIVVIYGPEKRLAKVITATAELERGTLESRLGELDGRPIIVKTPAGDADLRAGSVVFTAHDGGASVLSNHGGRPVELRGRTKTKSAVKITAGMGTRVVAGKAPEPPRPLPATPTWISSAGPRIASSTGTIALSWNASERATSYRVAVLGSSGDLIEGHHVAAPATALELALAPGAYRISVAALDADGLESVPSTPLEVARILPSFVAPSGRTPAPGAATPRLVSAGTTIIAPDGMRCSAGGTFESRLVLARAGETTVRCTDAAQRVSEPLQVLVVEPVTEPPSEPANVTARAPVVAPHAVPGDRLELGAFVGYHSLAIRRPISLADGGDRAMALEDGTVGGIRAGYVRARYGVEAELGLSGLGRRAGDGAQALDAGLHATARHDAGRVSLRLLAGAFLSSVVHDSERDAGSTAVGLSWGGAATIALDRVDLRMDLRHEIASGVGTAVGHGLLATIGASMRLR